jgi:hypothetical protein
VEVGEETSGSGCASQAKQSKEESKKQQEEEKGQAAAMPASPNLFKVLTAEDPKSLLEDEIGCMTGIFQIFDRSQAFTGRRYGSKRVTSAAGNKIQSHPTFLPCLPSLHTHSHSCHPSIHIPFHAISPHIPACLPSLKHNSCKALTPLYTFVEKALQSSHTHVFICQEEAHSHPCIVFLCVSVCVFFFSGGCTDQSLSVSACESPRHDRSSSNPYWMVRCFFLLCHLSL